MATNPTLSWGTSSGATSYEYCYATTTGCTGWTSVGTNTSVALSGLSNNQIYYWQVRAVNAGGTTLANTGTYWSFTTIMNSYTLTVTKDGTGSGLVSSLPTGIDCGSTCSADFAENTIVVLTATPMSPSVFEGWNGSGCSGTGACTLTMDSIKSVTAVFKYIWNYFLPLIAGF